MSANPSSSCLASGFVVVQGIKPHPDQNKTVIMDLCLSVSGRESGHVRGEARYFKPDHVTFPNGQFVAVAHFSLASVNSKVILFGDRTEIEFIADIKTISALGDPGVVDFNFDVPPQLFISGAATNSNHDRGTFAIEGTQHTAAGKETKEKDHRNVMTIFHTEFAFKQSARWGSKYPVPYPRKLVSVSGSLNNIRTDLDVSGAIENVSTFCVDVDNITFMGTLSADLKSSVIGNSFATPTPTIPRSNPFKRQLTRTDSEASIPAGKRPAITAMEDEDDSAGPSSPSPFVSTSTFPASQSSSD